MTITHEAPATLVKSELLVDSPGLKIVRMDLPPGEALPVHPTPRYTLIVVFEGTGQVTVDDSIADVAPGSVVEVQAGEAHAVHADERLRFVMMQANIEDEREPDLGPHDTIPNGPLH
ncbi:MAG TPA: cupin domain-containing protein [Myxococcota bacterium]